MSFQVKKAARTVVALTAAVVVGGTALLGCSSNDSGDSGMGLPGPVPAGVSFREPPADAVDAPQLSFDFLDGAKAATADLATERPVVLVFFSSYCDTCASAQPDLNALAKKYRNKVVFIGVAREDKAADVAAFVKKYAVTYPVAIDTDGKQSEKYAVRESPLIALISQGGKLLRGWPGGIDAATLDGQLKELAIK